MMLSASSYATRKKRTKPPPVPIDFELKTFNITPFITGGFLIGDEAAQLDNFRRAVYGGGVRFEYMVTPVVRFDASLEALFAKLSDSSYSQARSLSYSAGALFMLTPGNRTSFYTRGELGWANLGAPNIETDPGTHFFFRAALGQSSFSSPTRAIRFEFYYKVIYTSNYGAYPKTGKIDFNITHVGMLIGMAFGL